MRKCETPNGKKSSQNEWAHHSNKFVKRAHWSSVRGIVRAYLKSGWMAER